jgi:hypothetical protein
MTSFHILARQLASELSIASSLSHQRAQGMPGASRTRSLREKTRRSSPQVRRKRPAFPARMVLTASFVLAPETGFVVSVGDNARALHRIPASGYQAHTTSPSACRSLVSRTTSVHRIPRPTFGDDRETPLMRAQDARRSARDLPDVTSESACDTLARRANQFFGAELFARKLWRRVPSHQ